MRVYVSIALFLFLQGFVIAANSRYYISPSQAGSSAKVVRLAMIDGMSEHADSVFGNPASLYRINKLSTSFYTTTFMDEVKYQNMALALRFSFGTLGIGIMDLTVDDINKTAYQNNRPVIDSYFNYRNSLIKLCYGFSQSERIHFGVSGSYFFNKFDTVSASAINMDVGTIIKFKRMEASVLMRNMLGSKDVVFSDTETGSESSDGQKEKLALETVYSLKYNRGDFNIYGQLKTVGSDRAFQKHIAIEYKPQFLPIVSVSAGVYKYSLLHYQEGQLLDEEKLTGSFGLSLDLKGVNFDYAYEKSEHIEFDQKHFFSAGVSF